MSKTAYWKTTTGYNTADYPVTLGKQLNQCTAAELAAHPMCGANSPLANTCYVGKVSDLLYGSVLGHVANAQFKDPPPNSMTNTWICEPCVEGDERLIYSRTIFIAAPTNISIPQYCLTDQCDNSFLIVDDITAPNKLVYNYGNINFAPNATPIFRTGGLALKHTCQKGQSAHSGAPSYVVYTDNTDPDNPVTTNYTIFLSHLYIVGDDAFLVNFDYIGNFGGRYQNASNCYNCIDGGSSYTSFKSENGNALFLGINVNATGGETNLQGIFGNDIFADPVPSPPVFANSPITYAPSNILLQNAKLNFSLANSTISGSLASRFLSILLYDTEEIRKQQMARGGVYFVINGELFKPKISGGIVIGYCTPDQESEIDTYNDLTHPVPSGGGGGDGEVKNVETEMPTAYIGGLAGMVNYIKINSAGLAYSSDISDALSRFDITTIGKDLLRNFVAFKCFALLNIDPANCVTRQITVAGHCLEDENGNALQGLYIGGVKPIDFTIGTVDRLYKDFRDYAPYTKIECYVPFCGWFTLPSWCIGQRITGTMFTDVYNGTVKAIIYASDTVVAEVGGCCAYDIPFVADATGAKAGAVISSALSTAAATAATVAMPNVATGIAAASSAANMLCAINSNATTLKGVLGDGSNLNGLLHCYLKVTRPQSPTAKTRRPDSYAPECGIPCYKSLELTSGMGFTQVNDANISGTMTAEEKQMIVDGFRHGLIL